MIDILDQILSLDFALFEAIACKGRTPFLDSVMPYWRSRFLWIPLYVFVIAWLFQHQRPRAFLVLFGALFTFGAADFTAASLIKPWVGRLRPCRTAELINGCLDPLIHCGSGYSFPSAHASNHMGLAIFFMLVFSERLGHWKWLLLLWALSISYGQVYVGVHFPSDVLFGSLLGGLFGFIFARLLRIIG